MESIGTSAPQCMKTRMIATALLTAAFLAGVLLVPGKSPFQQEPLSPRPEKAGVESTEPGMPPPVSTYSIIARDPDTGEIGIAVQSKFVAVGAVVPYADARLGAVATQAYANTRYGEVGLLGLKLGMEPEQVIRLLTTDDPERESRQVAILDREGRGAVFTGSECHPWAGGRTGENYCVQGNLLAGPEVIEEMERAFLEHRGELAERLIAALKAGEAAGGDRRGRQSASLLIVREGWGYGGLSDRFRDLRVDDHPEPIEELERVYRAHQRLFPRP